MNINFRFSLPVMSPLGLGEMRYALFRYNTNGTGNGDMSLVTPSFLGWERGR